MNFKAKALTVLALTAMLLTSCGSPVESSPSVSVPSIDELPEKTAEVNVHSADAPSADMTIIDTDSAEVNIVTSPEYDTYDSSYYDENGEKMDFSFTVDYDEEFFDDDLFIGDSISTGYSGYGILNEKNVFAKIGLNPLSALDTEVTTVNGDMLLSDAVSLAAPKRAYVMLGSNGIDWLACSNMLDAISSIVDAIHDASPETQIICLTIPPVTKEYDDANEELDVMDKIHDYNSRLAQLCDDKDIQCIDITTMLEDNEGYFIDYYAETDGMHFKPTAYKMILTKIQYTLS